MWKFGSRSSAQALGLVRGLSNESNGRPCDAALGWSPDACSCSLARQARRGGPAADHRSPGSRTARTGLVRGRAHQLRGCAAGARGPLRGPGVQLAGDYQVAFSRAEATLPGGEVTSGTSDHYWSPYAVAQRRLELRASILPWFDVGTDIGWLDGGVDGRVGLPAAPGVEWAMQVAGGWRSGAQGPIEHTKSTNARWLRLEAYPLLRERISNDGSLYQMRGILGLGVSDGRFIHQLPDPRISLHEGSDGFSPDVIRVEREETRVDVALGADFFGAPAAAVTIFAQGYAVLNSSCVDCDDVARYSQGWGASLVLRGSFVLGWSSWWRVERR